MPLCVFELKRQGLALTAEDEAQGLSYANLLQPRFPLVVITNGDETRFLESHNGKTWQPSSPSEEGSLALLARIDIALRETAKLADDIRHPWAEEVRSECIAPALQKIFACQTE